MKHFTDRIFYLEKDGALAHISYLTSGNWAVYLLEGAGDWEWQVDSAYATYEQAYRTITYRDPTVLLQEEWYAA